MNIERERAAFEWWASDEGESPRAVERVGECYKLAQIQSYWIAWQARAALQLQPTEAFLCRIIEADFETGTVTLEMQGKYTVSAGQKYLCNAPLQSQDREDAERLDWIEANHGCDITEFADGTWEVDVPDGPYGVGKGMREAIDHARRAEGDGE